jgi:hypothetical protein
MGNYTQLAVREPRPWTDDEILFVKNFKRLNTISFLANRLRRKESEVEKVIKELGIDVKPIVKISLKELSDTTPVAKALVVPATVSRKKKTDLEYDAEDISRPTGTLWDIIPPLPEPKEYSLRGRVAENVIYSLI